MSEGHVTPVSDYEVSNSVRLTNSEEGSGSKSPSAIDVEEVQSPGPGAEPMLIEGEHELTLPERENLN